MKHELEGILTKFDEPWFNGVTISPEAFKSCDQTRVPITERAHFGTIEDLGYAILLWKPDGIYYHAYLKESDEADEMIDLVCEKRWRLGMFANQIKKEDKCVTAGKICGLFFARRCDAAAVVTKVDGADIDQITIDVEKYKEKLKYVTDRIRDLELTIQNMQGELEDFRINKLEIESLLKEAAK